MFSEFFSNLCMQGRYTSGGRGRGAVVLIVVMASLLAGCAAPTIRSEVTTFHEWPTLLPGERTYVFERTKEQDNNLEYRNYENLVRTELNRLGFVEASPLHPPWLKAMLSYDVKVRDVHEIYPVIVDPYPYLPIMNPRWRGTGWPGYYGPFYDPFWYGPPVVEQREKRYQLYTRQLRVVLARAADGKRLYETTVVSEGTNGSLAAAMPYMVHSAFLDFPGKNGVPHLVELKMRQ